MSAPNPEASKRFYEFFTANIRNANTRRAYARAAKEFAFWCEHNGFEDLNDIEPIHVAAYIETLQMRLEPPSVKQNLAAIPMLFNWLVVGHVLMMNPASVVRGPKHSVKKGKTPVLTVEEARTLLDSIPTETDMDVRDRALIGLMIYTFARVGAALHMRMEDVYIQGRRTPRFACMKKAANTMKCRAITIWMPTIHAYLERMDEKDPKAPLFRSSTPRTKTLTERPMTQPDAYRMIGRRAIKAGIATKIGNHSFRATGITEYLRNGDKLEIAQQMANHESARTTGLYDRRNDQASLDEVERIVI